MRVGGLLLLWTLGGDWAVASLLHAREIVPLIIGSLAGTLALLQLEPGTVRIPPAAVWDTGLVVLWGWMGAGSVEGTVTWTRGILTIKLFTTVCRGSRTWREAGDAAVSAHERASVTVVLTAGDKVDTPDWLASVGTTEVVGGCGEEDV